MITADLWFVSLARSAKGHEHAGDFNERDFARLIIRHQSDGILQLYGFDSSAINYDKYVQTYPPEENAENRDLCSPRRLTL